MDEYLLIVDDNVENLKVVGTFLKDQGYKIAIARSGSDAFKVLESVIPSLILLDVMMPEMDGYEVCRRLKQNEALADVPVIFLTAKSDTEDIVRGFEVGGVDYLAKPFNVSELRVRVKNQIDLQRSKKTIIQQSDELLKYNQTQNQIFTIIGHDIRTPLASMNMLLNDLLTIEKDSISPKHLKTLSLMEGLTKETYQMLDNLLQWSRVQMNHIKYTPVLFNINIMVSKVIHLYQAAISEKSLNLSFDNSAEQIVYADENMTMVILRNLINNAVKFTPKGGSIVIKTTKKNEMVVTYVTDSGQGIDNQNVNQMFSGADFHSTQGTEGEKGTGLGLKICNNFVELNQGKIGVDNNPPLGCTFYFSLPARKPMPVKA